LFIAGSICLLCKVDVQALWGFRVVAICGTKGMGCIDIVKNGMEFRYVEMLLNSKADEDLFVLMKCFQAVFCALREVVVWD